MFSRLQLSGSLWVKCNLYNYNHVCKTMPIKCIFTQKLYQNVSKSFWKHALKMNWKSWKANIIRESPSSGLLNLSIEYQYTNIQMFGLTHWVHVVQVIHKVSLSQVNCHLQTNHSVTFHSLTLITTADDDWISWSETISDVTVNRN